MKVYSTFLCRFSRNPSLLYTSESVYHFASKQFEIMKQPQFMQLQAMRMLALNFRFVLVFDNSKIGVQVRNKLTLCKLNIALQTIFSLLLCIAPAHD